MDPSGAVSGSRTAENSLGRVGDAADKAKRSADGLMSDLRGLGGALKIGAIIAGVTAYNRMVDAVKSAQGQLRLATKNQQDLNREAEKAYAIAQKQGTSYTATTTLLAKSVKAATSLGLTYEVALKKGEAAAAATSAAVRVSGTDASAASNGIMQLNQALASGTLRGDELNSVMENIPALGDAIAKAMGKGTGELRKMGAAGQLTSKAVLDALEKARPELERLADLIPLTFGAALQKVKNSAENFTFKFDQGTSLSAGFIAALDVISKTLDALTNHIEAVSNIIVGLLVSAALKSASAFRASAASAVADATAKLGDIRATQALAVAESELAAAQVARARASMGATGAGVTADAVKTAEAAAAKVAALGAEVATAEKAVAGATARTGLFGAAMVRAATIGRAALALVGGPIGLIVTALAAVLLWAGKAALGFQPIAGEAGTVGDYIAVAFEDATKWAGDKLGEFSSWAGQKFSDIIGYVRPVYVFIIDAFLNAARGAAGAVAGVVAAWRAGVDNIKGIIAGLASDAAQATKGNFTTAGTSAALANSVSIGQAFGKGVQEGFDNTFKGVTGEKVVGDAVAFVGSIPGRISTAFKNSGYRNRANQRAADRAKLGEGGYAGPGTPTVPTEKTKKEKKAKDETTFDDILKEAKEAAYVASLNTAEAERTTAVFSAQKTLKRDLTKQEMILLGTAIDLKRTNEANLALDNATKDTIQAAGEARVKALADQAREAGNFNYAAQLEAELLVQQKIAQAKRDQVPLDQAKLEAYRAAVTQAAQENEVIKQQQEARRQLQAIADNARKSIQSAVSDAIYDGLSGNIKGVGGLFKSIGNILRRQMAEQITYGIFEGAKDQANQATITGKAITIVTPAAVALANATNTVTAALGGAPVQIDQATDQFTGVLTGAVGPLSQAISGILGVFGLMGKGSLMGGGGASTAAPTAGIGKFLGPQGPIASLGNKLGNLVGLQTKTLKDGTQVSAGSQLMQKAGQGMMIGQMTGSVLKGLGVKTSSTGSSIGGALGGVAFGPLGAAIGGALGGIVGGMLKKVKYGAVTLSGSKGSLNVSDARGNSSSAKKAASGAGDNIKETLQKYADALGAGIGDFGDISVGTRHGDYRVNDKGTSLKVKKGAVDFDDDAQAAIEYAIQLAIEKGAFTGLSEGISNALKAGKATVDEAVSFQATAKDIRYQAQALTDPIGAAIGQLDDQFNALRKQYALFGESTVDLEKVYQDKRVQAIKDAQKDLLADTRSFLEELKGGTSNLSNVSKVDQVRYQDASFAAIEQAQASGQAVDYEKLNSVGHALLEASKELYGNTPEYQAQVDRVMAALEKAVNDGSNPNVSMITTAQPVVEAAYSTTSAVQDTNAAIADQTVKTIAVLNAVGAEAVKTNGLLAKSLDALGVLAYAKTGNSQFVTANF